MPFITNNFAKLTALFIVWTLVITGCTYPSGEKVFHQIDSEVKAEDGDDAYQFLKTALETTQQAEIAEKFWYSGWVANDVQKRRTNSMYDGVVVRPHGYLVNARVAANPYRYYKWDDQYYLHTAHSGWVKLDEEQVPFDPLEGFTWWEPVLQDAIRLPDGEVLSKKTRVYQVMLKGNEWLRLDNPQFNRLQDTIAQTPGMDQILENTTVKMTLWIGDEEYTADQVRDWAARKGVDTDNGAEWKKWAEQNGFIRDEEEDLYRLHLIYQYETWINMPVPGAGYMDQQIFFRFYKYDDPGIKMRTPEEMEQYVQEDE